jgi:hypothetical protein
LQEKILGKNLESHIFVGSILLRAAHAETVEIIQRIKAFSRKNLGKKFEKSHFCRKYP